MDERNEIDRLDESVADLQSENIKRLKAALAELREKAHALYREAYGPSRAIQEVSALCDALGESLDASDVELASRFSRRVDAEKEREELREALSAPPNTPLLPGILELKRERDEARFLLAEYEKTVGSVERVRKAVADLLTPHLQKAKTSPFDSQWVRDMILQGFVPSRALDKLRDESNKLRGEMDHWHSIVSRLRNHLPLPTDLTHAQVPDFIEGVLRKERVRGAQWMREAREKETGGLPDPEKVVSAREEQR